MIRTLTIAFALTLAVACGSSDAAVAVSTAVPTFVPPTPVPPLTDISSLTGRGLLGFDVVKVFPEELKSDSPPLDRSDAVELMRAFVSNTRIVHGESITDFCSDGSGLYVSSRAIDDEKLHWEVKTNPAGRWNEVRILHSPDNPEMAALFVGGQGTIITRPPVDEKLAWGTADEETIVFDNPTCGQ